MCLKKRTGQSSMEFVLIAAVMFLIFLGIFVVIQERMSQAYKGRLYTSMEELSRLVSTEIRMASSASGYYIRRFTLPLAIGGYDYVIEMPSQSEIVIRAEGLDYVVFLEHNISGSILKGPNFILNTGGNNISINPSGWGLCSDGAGSDDSNCGVIDCSGWYAKSGNNCYNKHDITTARCEGVSDCKDNNSVDCNAQTDDALQYSCSVCQYIDAPDCSGTNLGACSNLSVGTECGGGKLCDGFGHCNVDLGGTAFVIKDHAGQNITKFDEEGNIILRGACTASASCAAPADSFVIKSSGGDVVAYIDLSGNLCIEDTNCSSTDPICSAAGNNSFVIKDSSEKNIIFINDTGALCLLGSLIQGGNP